MNPYKISKPLTQNQLYKQAALIRCPKCNLLMKIVGSYKQDKHDTAFNLHCEHHGYFGVALSEYQ